MTPKQLSEQIGIDQKKIRQTARKWFGKPDGGKWNFTELQVQQLKQILLGQPTELTKSIATVAAPVAEPKTDDWRSIEYLTEYADNFLYNNYGIHLEIPLRWNGRLKRALGYFKLGKRSGAIEICLSEELLRHYGKDTTIDVLKHELIHYALYTLGKPYKDGHPVFENELRKHGVSSTRTIQPKGLFHQYTCSDCGKQVGLRSRKIRKIEGYYSRCCKVGLTYNGQVEV